MFRLYGVRYFDPDTGFLLTVGAKADAAALSAHADCPTWVVEVIEVVDGDDVQIGPPLAYHESRVSPGFTVWLRKAPPSRAQVAEHKRKMDRPSPKTVGALLALDGRGEATDDVHTAAAMWRRGWTDITGRDITEKGREAAKRHRAAFAEPVAVSA